jgi:hypothetical protein
MKKRLMKFYAVLVVFSLFAFASYSQSTDRKFLKYESTDASIKIFVSDGFMKSYLLTIK